MANDFVPGCFNGSFHLLEEVCWGLQGHYFAALQVGRVEVLLGLVVGSSSPTF